MVSSRPLNNHSCYIMVTPHVSSIIARKEVSPSWCLATFPKCGPVSPPLPSFLTHPPKDGVASASAGASEGRNGFILLKTVAVPEQNAILRQHPFSIK